MTSAERAEHSRACHAWMAAFLFAVVGALDAIVYVLAIMQFVGSLQAFILHCALVACLAVALSLPLFSGHRDVALFAVVSVAVAGPLGAFAATWLSAGEEEVRRDATHRAPLGTSSRGRRVDDPVARLRNERAVSTEYSAPIRFCETMQRGSLKDRLGVLAIIGQNYDPAFRGIIDTALSCDSGSVRAQAAALLTSLSNRYQRRLQAALSGSCCQGDEDDENRAAELAACISSGLLEPVHVERARRALASLEAMRPHVGGPANVAEDAEFLTAPGSHPGGSPCSTS